MTKQQKKDVRKGLRRYGRAMEAAEDTPDELTQAWGRVIGKALHIGRTTYYRKELEALSTVGLFAAREGLV